MLQMSQCWGGNTAKCGWKDYLPRNHGWLIHNENRHKKWEYILEYMQLTTYSCKKLTDLLWTFACIKHLTNVDIHFLFYCINIPKLFTFAVYLHLFVLAINTSTPLPLTPTLQILLIPNLLRRSAKITIYIYSYSIFIECTINVFLQVPMAYWAFCRHQVGILYMIVVYLTPLALSECDILSPVSYSAEQYCADLDNVTILNVAQWECRYICIQKARCGGIKYSPLKGTCILLENCALTDESNPVIYTIISSTEGSECLEWLQFPEDRWVHTKYGGDINWKKGGKSQCWWAVLPWLWVHIGILPCNWRYKSNKAYRPISLWGLTCEGRMYGGLCDVLGWRGDPTWCSRGRKIGGWESNVCGLIWQYLETTGCFEWMLPWRISAPLAFVR